jgi:ABC transporter substrate binding protein
MKRRAFVLGLGTAAVGWPLRARAERAFRNVALWWSPAQLNDELSRYKRRLAELGWLEDRNLRFQGRAWEGDTGMMREQAAELMAIHPDVIVVSSNPALAILKPLSNRVPIVFVFVADPVGGGFVESLAHPGGNITGFTNFEPAMGGKWLEVLREAVPTITKVLVIMHPETAAHREFWRTIEEVAGPLHIEAFGPAFTIRQRLRVRSPGSPKEARGASLRYHTPSVKFIAILSSSKRLRAPYQASSLSQPTPPLAHSSRTGLIARKRYCRPQSMSTGSSAARSRRTCRFKRRKRSKWL